MSARVLVSLLAIALAGGAPPARAATFIVDTTADLGDPEPGDGTCGHPDDGCSIRAAVMEANALPGPDVVEVPAGTYASSSVDVLDHLTVVGMGHPSVGSFVIPAEAEGVALVLEDLQLSGVVARGGSLVLKRCSVVQGQLIAEGAVLSASHCHVTGFRGFNASDQAVQLRSTLAVFERTTIANCSTSAFHGEVLGGAMFILSSSVIFQSCTIAHNGASNSGGLADGGAMYVSGSFVRLASCTVTRNGAFGGSAGVTGSGGIHVDHASSSIVRLANTVLADNEGRWPYERPNCAGSFVIAGPIVIDDDQGCTFDNPDGHDIWLEEPGLGPLTHDGGLVPTCAPLADSIVIDRGSCSPGTDQRLLLRPRGAACDIGAVEACFDTTDPDGDGLTNCLDACPQIADDGMDTDLDGVGDACDNCMVLPNDQADGDGDGLGDACDPCPSVAESVQVDVDSDGHGDACDNCLTEPNPGQEDCTEDGVGDACDPDDVDGDGVPGPCDACPAIHDDQADSDSDGLGDACDPCPSDASQDHSDADSDGIPAACDGCPDDHDPTEEDSDGDGVGDACDSCPDKFNPGQWDFDGDTVADPCDTCWQLANPEQADADSDGRGDECDICPQDDDPLQEDTDGDGFGDACDVCPDLVGHPHSDADGDGEGDACDLDDGVLWLTEVSRDGIGWQAEQSEGYDVHRGDLHVLRETGVYTQQPGTNPYAERACNVSSGTQWLDDALLPESSGDVIFYLVALRQTGIPADLGSDSAGSPRTAFAPCP